MANCIEGSAEVYQASFEKPWNKRRIQHLYNRMGTGASRTDIEWALTLTPAQVVDTLIDEAINSAIPTEDQYPLVTNHVYGFPSAGNNGDMYFNFLRDLVENPLRYKLVLFWSGHFVTENKISETRSSYLHYYLTNLHLNAFGDFKEMTKSIGLTPVMLSYLNGNRNYRNAPNENYARELLELFTMGPGNYTQNDIEEIARLLTGWRTEWNPYYISYDDEGNEIHTTNNNFISEFNQRILSENLHDWGTKEIMGKTRTPSEETQDEAYQEYLWLHDEVIFSEENADIIARFICGKLYQFYVYDEIDETFVESLAITFKNSNWQIEPVLRQLFKSEHFFDDKTIGGNIKSPLEYMLGFLRKAGLVYNEDYFRGPETTPHPTIPDVTISYFQYQLHRVFHDCTDIGQTLLAPPNVAGWEGGKAWITENTLVKRWDKLDGKIDFFKNVPLASTQVKFQQLVKDLTEDFTGNPNITDPAVVTEAIARHFIIADLSFSTLEAATGVFKSIVPQNYFDDGTWSLDFHTIPRQFIDLMIFLIKLPEYQLN